MSVPQWLVDAADGLVNSSIRTVLAAADPLPLELRTTELDFNLGFCQMKVNASTLNNVSGLSTSLKIGKWECLESECLESGQVGCNVHKIKLSSQLDFDVLHATGRDESRWHCGSDLPLRKIDFSYVLLDTRFKINIVFNLTYEGFMRTPIANVIEVEDIVTDLGTMHNQHCEDAGELPPLIVEPLLALFCKPMLGIIGAGFRDLYFPILDHSLQVLLNAVLKPKDNDSWSTQPLTDGLIVSVFTAVGFIAALGCLCCCVLSPRVRPRRAATPASVPAVLGVAVGQGHLEPRSAATMPRGRHVRMSVA